MNGPFETQRQAADSVRHIYDGPPGTGAWRDGCMRLLEDACCTAGVQLGAYDTGVLVWLATWEPATCAVIAGLIARAHQSPGDPDRALETLTEIREVLAAFDWERDDRQYALERIDRIAGGGQ